jgi:hypothetical protein
MFHCQQTQSLLSTLYILKILLFSSFFFFNLIDLIEKIIIHLIIQEFSLLEIFADFFINDVLCNKTISLH